MKSVPPTERLTQLRMVLDAETQDSRLLSQSPADNPICSIQTKPDLGCVKIIWKRYATSTQIRFVHELVLSALQHYGFRKILGDDRSLPTIHAEDQRWITEDWMPRAVAAGLRKCAGVYARAYFGRLSTEQVRARAPAPLEIQMFDTPEQAHAWLAN